MLFPLLALLLAAPSPITLEGDALRAAITSTPGGPRWLTVRVPEEGNYRVTVRLGSEATASTTTVKAEVRRLMVDGAVTAAGQFLTRSFVVNTRTPQLPDGGAVKLKPREKAGEAAAWDEAITLEFIGENPSVAEVRVEKASGLPTIFIAGDSTSTDQPGEPFNSWGQMLPRFFGQEIAVANHGESGESLRSFIGEGRLAKVMSVIREGDYLLVQMGHNDQKEKGEGLGAFTSYKADLKRFIGEARAKGATPILVTSMNRLTFDSAGRITNSLGDFPAAVREAGAEEHVAVIDLNAMSVPLYEAFGPVDAHLLFAGNDTTHHSDFGSYQFAKCVVESIIQQNLPLAKYLVPDLPRYNPAKPDVFNAFRVPAEPRGTTPKPFGN